MRYLPHTTEHRQKMCDAIGVKNIDELFDDVNPKAYLKDLVDLPLHQSEQEVEIRISRLAEKNLHAGQCPSFLGAGAYRHHIPASVDHIIQRGEFLTAYTPYQPEIAQGTLQYLFEFQTQVARIMGMDIANASMYDGSTACTEAIAMANRVTKRKKAIMSSNVHPHYVEIAQTHAHFAGFEIVHTAPTLKAENLIGQIDDQTSCVVVQYPDFFGNIQDHTKLAEACHANGALLVTVTTEIISLGALTPPGDFGADIAVAEGQSIGNPLGFGGPYVGLFTCTQKLMRQMPGRLCGETIDADGNRGFVLTLSTREQHIRREKATSNICTNSGLCALAFTIHMALLGETGFTHLAKLNHARAVQLKTILGKTPGIKVLNDTFFNEFTIELPKGAATIVDQLAKDGILAGVPVSRFYAAHENLLLVAATELTSESDMHEFALALKGAM